MDNNQVSEQPAGYTPAPEPFRNSTDYQQRICEFGNFMGGIVNATIIRYQQLPRRCVGILSQ